ncbi:unnamed protein product [Withania somnifera]
MALALKLLVISIAVLALASSPSSASDPIFVNGKICKVPKLATADDFFRSGLNKPGNTSNQLGSIVTTVNVNNLPRLNTLGISLARIDFARRGLNPPHTHPRGTEVLLKLFTKILNPGDIFVFLEGLIHFQLNVGMTDAIAFAGLSSQNPGAITIANAVFGSDTPINDEVLAKAFQVDKKVIDHLQEQFWWDNN